jgi:hypothetical protein
MHLSSAAPPQLEYWENSPYAGTCIFFIMLLSAGSRVEQDLQNKAGGGVLSG